MIQGGDPKGNGTGDAGYKFKDEIYTGNSNNEYTIAMANAGPNTNGSQFFINTKANNFLDTKHTVFGKVVKGQEVIDKIESVETGMADKPVEDVIIVKAVIAE
jgi:cyclophilin family peptidyl-prolyl cis-trans isomerase